MGPLEELKKTLAEIDAGIKEMREGRTSDSARVTTLEEMTKDLTQKLKETQVATRVEHGYFDREGGWVRTDEAQGPMRKAVMSGKAKGFEVKELWDSKSVDEEITEWQAQGDCYVIAAYARAHQGNMPYKEAWASLGGQIKSFSNWRSETDSLRKALDTATAGSGLEFIPTEFSRDLIDRVTLGLRVAALHRRIVIPRSPFQLSARVAALPRGFKVTERTTDSILTEANKLPASTPGTRKVTWTAKGVGGLTIFSTEFEEDSIIPAATFARDELVQGIQNAQEIAVINGIDDVAANSLDNDIVVAADETKAELIWDGYRVIAQKPSTNTTLDMAGVPTISKIRELRSKMGRYGANPSALAYAVSVSVMLKHIINFPEVLTLDKLGPSATILNGQLAQLDGSPIIVSDFQRDDVSATGFNTSGGPNDKSTILIVYRPGIVFGDVRGLRVETLRWPITEQVLVIGKLRSDFEELYDPTTETIVAMGINITP